MMTQVEADMMKHYAAVKRRLFARPAPAKTLVVEPEMRIDRVMPRVAAIPAEPAVEAEPAPVVEDVLDIPAIAPGVEIEIDEVAPPFLTSLRKISLPAIIMAVAETHEITGRDITGTARVDRLVRPRQQVCWIARAEGRYSLLQIGRVLNRDHTTILHAVRKVALQARSHPTMVDEIRAAVDRLENMWFEVGAIRSALRSLA